MEMAEGAPQPVLVGRSGNDVNMIGHQAVGPDLDIGPARGIGQQIEVERIVTLLKERPLAPVAALGDVVRNAGQHKAGQTDHCRRLLEGGGVSING